VLASGYRVAHGMHIRAVIATKRAPLTLAAVAALLGACAGAPPASPPARPVAAPALSLERNWHARAMIERDDSIVLTLPSGDHQLQQFHRSAVFTLGVTSEGVVTMRLDSLTLRPSDDASRTAMLPATWTGRVDDPHVDALRVAAGGEFAEELTSIVRQLLPRYPVGGAGRLSTWSDSATGKVRVDIFSATERRSAVWTTGPDGTLTLREEYEQMGSGSQGGQRLAMTSQGRRSCTYYSTPAGVPLTASLADSSTMLITILGSKQMVPTVRFGRTAVRFVSIPGDSSTE
jgi:hypothetical protein